MSKVTRFPTDSSARRKNSLGKFAVPCQVSDRYLQFSGKSHLVQGGEFMTIGSISRGSLPNAPYAIRPQPSPAQLDGLLALKFFGADAASAIAQVAARTDDTARDISDAARDAVLNRLTVAGAPDDLLRSIREHVSMDRLTGGRLFGETLPEGLRLEQ